MWVYISMSEVVWKCFRCNLSFIDDNLAEMHKNISNHSVSKVKSIVATSVWLNICLTIRQKTAPRNNCFGSSSLLFVKFGWNVEFV